MTERRSSGRVRGRRRHRPADGRHAGRHSGAVRSGGETIASVGSGRRVRVVRVEGGRRLVRRLAALGIVPGAELTVDRGSGPALVEVGHTRVAVDRTVAAAVEVEEVPA